MNQKAILNNVIELERYFLNGFQKATMLRKELEGVSTSSTRTGSKKKDLAKVIEHRNMQVQRKVAMAK